MISFDDLVNGGSGGGNDVLINDLKSSVYLLSNQQQTFESDLNNMMIDIQLISNSVTGMTSGGGGAEYYITASSDNTAKLSFCYNLKDNITGSTFADIYNNINMNGNVYSNNTISNSQSAIKQFYLNGADIITSNKFNSMDNCNINGCSDYYNSFKSINKLVENAFECFKDSFYSNNILDYTCYDVYSNTYSYCSNLHINANEITKNTFNTITLANCTGGLAGNRITNVKLGKFQGQNCSYNTFENVNFASIDMISIRYNTFNTIHNINFTGVNLKENTFGQVSTLNFDCNNMFSNSFTNIMSYLSGKAKSIYDNKIASALSRMYLNADMINNNTFANMTNCNIDAFTFSNNKFDTASEGNFIWMLNLTGESIDSNSFANLGIVDINAMTFIENTLGSISDLNFNGIVVSINSFSQDVANAHFQGRYLIGNEFTSISNLEIDNNFCTQNKFGYVTNADIRCNSFSENQIQASVLHGMFKGESNKISAIYGNFTGSMNTNTFTVLDGKFEGVFKENIFEALNSDGGSIYINNLASAMGMANTVKGCQNVTVVGNRAGYSFESIKSLWLENLLPGDTFSSIGTIYYSYSKNTPVSNYTGVTAISQLSLVFDVPNP